MAKLCALTLSKDIWSGPAVRILYLQSGPVRLVRSEKYTQPIQMIQTFLPCTSNQSLTSTAVGSIAAESDNSSSALGSHVISRGSNALNLAFHGNKKSILEIRNQFGNQKSIRKSEIIP